LKGNHVTLLLQQTLNGLGIGASYAIFAMGFTLVFATLDILNVAHGTYATWGALISFWIVKNLELSFPIALIGGVIGGGLIGILVDQVGFEPLRRRGGGRLGPVITSIAFWIILDDIALIATDARWRSFPAGTFPRHVLRFKGLFLPTTYLMNIITAIIVGVVLYAFVQRSRIGASMRAVGWSASKASISGVNPRLVIIFTSFLGGAVAGLAGVLHGLSTNNVSFALGEGLFLKGFVAVVLGGFGDFRGAVIAGLFIGVLEVLSAQYISNSFRDAISFGLVFAFLLFRPTGLFGKVEQA
jgi:branched-chain amino acid transport system permease protein